MEYQLDSMLDNIENKLNRNIFTNLILIYKSIQIGNHFIIE